MHDLSGQGMEGMVLLGPFMGQGRGSNGGLVSNGSMRWESQGLPGLGTVAVDWPGLVQPEWTPGHSGPQ